MAQGKEWTKEQREMIVQSLQPYLEMGLSRNRACSLIGLAPATLSNWVKEDPALGIKLTGWENAMNVLAIANLKSALEKEAETEDVKKETSKWWAERKMKEDFSTRTEQTGADGQPLVIALAESIVNKYAPESQTERDSQEQ